MDIANPPCELCNQPGGTLLWQGQDYRVVRVNDPFYPGFCRVIWQAHVREMTDLDEASRWRLMRVVFAVESVIRDLFNPIKINLASFGNLVPHIHWHIIPRWSDDRCFPEPIWGEARREGDVKHQAVSEATMIQALASVLNKID